MELSNAAVAKMLRQIAAAYTLKRANLFQIRAYENAADAIEHATSEIKDLWDEGNLDQIPGIGESLKSHLDELFKTGKVKHWEEVKKGIPGQVFDFLQIPGVGPKTALELAKAGAKDIADLQQKLQQGVLVEQGFSEKIAAKILTSLEKMEKGESKRMLLPYAYAHAQTVLDYLRQNPQVKQADVLGSLRRMVATIGDLDFAIASDDPQEVADYLIRMPGVVQVIDKGETKVTLKLQSGLQLDFLITKPENYGALLQHFTGSKSHNIHLRTLAENKGLSLSEYGVKNIKTGKVHPTKTEEEFYQLLDMEVPPPEIREDNGEIELALKYSLPHLIELKDIKGDFHLHDNFPIEPSHDLGVNSVDQITHKAKQLGYEYIGISDHSPSIGNHTKDEIIKLIEKHKKYIEQYNYSYKDIRILNLLEVDIQTNGELSVPDKGLALLDFAIASIHSAFNQGKETMTKRILKALENPYVKVLGHPTGRLLNKRQSYEVDWEVVFKMAAKNNIALEINAFPDRLDLPDNLVKIAKDFGVKFAINTDSHEVSQMEQMKFGVAVARRGWATKEDIVNSWEWTRLVKWCKIRT